MKQTELAANKLLHKLTFLVQDTLEAAELNLPENCEMSEKDAAAMIAFTFGGMLADLINAIITYRLGQLTLKAIDTYEPDKQP